MIQVYYLRNETEWSPHTRRLLMCRLPEEIQQRAERFRRWQDAQAYLAGKLLLAHIFRISSSELAISYTENGRPYIHDVCDFNISHSDGLVVVGVSSQGRIGIDIEAEAEIDAFVYRRLFTPEEWKNIVGAGHDIARRFYECWTIKEAVLKADGCGLIHPMDRVQVSDQKAYFNRKWWTVKKLHIAPGYTCHIATDIPQAVHLPRDLSSAIDIYEI